MTRPLGGQRINVVTKHKKSFKAQTVRVDNTKMSLSTQTALNLQGLTGCDLCDWTGKLREKGKHTKEHQEKSWQKQPKK